MAGLMAKADLEAAIARKTLKFDRQLDNIYINGHKSPHVIDVRRVIHMRHNGKLREQPFTQILNQKRKPTPQSFNAYEQIFSKIALVPQGESTPFQGTLCVMSAASCVNGPLEQKGDIPEKRIGGCCGDASHGMFNVL
jgi:hypothetical protein